MKYCNNQASHCLALHKISLPYSIYPISAFGGTSFMLRKLREKPKPML